MKKSLDYIRTLTMSSILFIFLLLLSGCAKTCEVDGCNHEVLEPESENSKYCYVHTCLEENCLNKVFFPPENVEYSYGSGCDCYCEEHIEHVFEISNLKLTNKDSAVTLTGTISNVSENDYYTVFIEANFDTSDSMKNESTYVKNLVAGDSTDFEIQLKNVEAIRWARIVIGEVGISTAGKTEWIELNDFRGWNVEP